MWSFRGRNKFRHGVHSYSWGVGNKRRDIKTATACLCGPHIKGLETSIFDHACKRHHLLNIVIAVGSQRFISGKINSKSMQKMDAENDPLQKNYVIEFLKWIKLSSPTHLPGCIIAWPRIQCGHYADWRTYGQAGAVLANLTPPFIHMFPSFECSFSCSNDLFQLPALNSSKLSSLQIVILEEWPCRSELIRNFIVISVSICFASAGFASLMGSPNVLSRPHLSPVNKLLFFKAIVSTFCPHFF